MENLLNSFPFRNTYDVVLIQGKHLRQALEHSVANMEPDGRNEAGRFLQVITGQNNHKMLYMYIAQNTVMESNNIAMSVP